MKNVNASSAIDVDNPKVPQHAACQSIAQSLSPLMDAFGLAIVPIFDNCGHPMQEFTKSYRTNKA